MLFLRLGRCLWILGYMYLFLMYVCMVSVLMICFVSEFLVLVVPLLVFSKVWNSLWMVLWLLCSRMIVLVDIGVFWEVVVWCYYCVVRGLRLYFGSFGCC